MATPDCWASIFAAVTYWLPGPNIFDTAGMEAVPNVIAAMACAPPALKMLVTPATCAAYNTAGCTLPSFCGGVHKIISRQPANCAGIASINTVENNGAVPPGM